MQAAGQHEAVTVALLDQIGLELEPTIGARQHRKGLAAPLRRQADLLLSRRPQAKPRSLRAGHFRAPGDRQALAHSASAAKARRLWCARLISLSGAAGGRGGWMSPVALSTTTRQLLPLPRAVAGSRKGRSAKCALS